MLLRALRVLLVNYYAAVIGGFLLLAAIYLLCGIRAARGRFDVRLVADSRFLHWGLDWIQNLVFHNQDFCVLGRFMERSVYSNLEMIRGMVSRFIICLSYIDCSDIFSLFAEHVDTLNLTNLRFVFLIWNFLIKLCVWSCFYSPDSDMRTSFIQVDLADTNFLEMAHLDF